MKKISEQINNINFVLTVCMKCNPSHAENCPKCFGWGFWTGYCSYPISGGDISIVSNNWCKCDICGGTPCM